MRPFECPEAHRAGLEEVKHAVNIHHSYLDSWIYLFFENKYFNVKETVDKLNRRDIMEKSVFSLYKLRLSTKKSLRSGIVQYVGNDYEGRPVLYFNTCRDFPKAEEREERQENFDMFLSWSVRCSRENPTSKVIWLINQKDSSLRKNIDLIFQKDMALRVSKFFPGVVAKMYICNMSTTLTLMLRPLLRQLPSSISDCVFFFSGSDLSKGKLLEFIPENVLPVAMGGKHDCDHRSNYDLYAKNVEDYFEKCIKALHSGISIKEMEMMEEYGVDRQGQPLSPHSSMDDSCREDTSATSCNGGIRMSESLMNRSPRSVRCGYRPTNSIRLTQHGHHGSVEVSPLHRSLQRSSLPFSIPSQNEGHETLQDGSYSFRSSALCSHDDNSVNSIGNGNTAGGYSTTAISAANSPMALKAFSVTEGIICLPIPNFKTVSIFPFRDLVNFPTSTRKRVDGLLRELCFYGEKIASQVTPIMVCLRDGHPRRTCSNASMVCLLRQNAEIIAHVAHSLLCLFPPTSVRLNYPIFAWLIDPVLERETLSQLSPEWWGEASFLDCTSPDNLLLALQTFAVEYIDDCDLLIRENLMARNLLTRIGNFWPSNLTYREVLALLDERCSTAWRMLVPHFRQYVECKVALAIVEFVRFHSLLVSGGRIDVNAEWYQKLLSAMIQYREMRRRTYIFHVYPPLFCEEQVFFSPQGKGKVVSSDEKNESIKKKVSFEKTEYRIPSFSSPPSAEELLRLRGLSLSFHNVIRVVCLVERSLKNTLQQLASPVTVNIAAHTVVERYLENTMSKISISYESQRNGLTPPELAVQKQTEAYRCLEAAQVSLTEYLFSLAAITWINEKKEFLSSKYHSWAGMTHQLQEELRDVSTCLRIRERSRLIANGLAAEAYNMQGSFACSAFSPDLRTDEPPEGYAAALSLLFIAAAATQSAASKNELTVGPSSTYLGTESIPTTDALTAMSGEVSSAEEFMKTIHGIQKCTSSLLREVAP